MAKTTGSTKRLIIDTDAGVDDAIAIMYGLSFQNIDVLAITACYGNTSLNHVVQNVAKTLYVCNKLDIPIYVGTHQPLVRNITPDLYFHGVDGFGDTDLPQVPDSLCNIKRDLHAALAIIEITRKYPNEVTILVLGPMTNLALALRLDSSLPSRVKELVWMGGAVDSRGNTGMSTEFNLHSDPESAYIVLTSFPMSTMVSWELTIKSALPWEFFNGLLERQNDRARFLKKICAKAYSDNDPAGAIICDVIAMAVILDPSIVKASQTKFVGIELQGEFTRGQTLIDWYRRFPQFTPNVCIIDEINTELFYEYMSHMVSQVIHPSCLSFESC